MGEGDEQNMPEDGRWEKCEVQEAGRFQGPSFSPSCL